jgi:hypothetical protein
MNDSLLKGKIMNVQNIKRKADNALKALSLVQFKNAQQSVHLTLGILRTSQAVFYALSFFWLDGFAVPAPAQVTQTVGRWRERKKT